MTSQQFFFSTNTQDGEKIAVSSILRVRRSNDPERYLGLPNMVGRNKRSSFQALKDRFKQRIDNWSISHLFQGGKESLCAELEGIIAKFWWQRGRDKKGIHWCAWKELCSLKEDGGLGFRTLAKFNIALLAKQGWRLINFPNSLLSRVLKEKYYPNSNFYNARLGNLPSLVTARFCMIESRKVEFGSGSGKNESYRVNDLFRRFHIRVISKLAWIRGLTEIALHYPTITRDKGVCLSRVRYTVMLPGRVFPGVEIEI
ncbi:reverse transcriptase [Gossypium australe]|uniref:Reverse transcriptase n=1 Tax=Gossypium australe TaxID=47621 RepID=A0A5B6UXN8_9ROSI|nr:reverse transcriptase [Gossypium australe]